MAVTKVRKTGLGRWFFPLHLLIFSLSMPLILDPNLGRYLWLQYRQETIKREVAEEIARGLEKEKLVQLAFTLEEVRTKLKWRSAKEFEFNHELYDLVEVELENDRIIFWCWPDQEETKIEREKGATVAAFFKNKGKVLLTSQEIESIFKIYYFMAVAPFFVAKPNLFSHLFISILDFTDSLNRQPPSPPPRPSA